jgi:1-acyl-sn-glycerol-3-phosphate acyltransferase
VFQVASLSVWGPLFLVLGPFLPYRTRYWLAMRWPAMNIWAARVLLGIRYQVIGTENLPDGPAILLSKHESAWETLFYPSFFHKPLCFVLKRELLRIPLFGWALLLLRMIAIDRSKGQLAFEKMVKQSEDVLYRQDRWMVLFPEGTRVRPGHHMRFKTGGARLAIASRTPVVPIAMNSGDLWPRQSFIKKPGLITVSIGPALLPESEDPTTLMAKVESWINKEMQRISPDRPLKGTA